MSQYEAWNPCLESQNETDEILLVQASGYDGWFLDTLEAFKVEYERIPGVPGWIQFEIPSFKLQWLMRAYADVTIEVMD
ncbi:MAG: hypothetical protein GYA24_22405 [Candidatus Lokiarchaeota archaeon]|nr:hypothetical protein [Candidatus Lokiarchaeota archaeon]